MRRLAKTIAAASLLLALPAFSATDSAAPADSVAVQADTASADTSHFQWWSAVPVLGYTEETELQYGAMVNFFIPSSFKGGNSQEIDIAAYGSTRKQFQFAATPYFYLAHDRISGWLDFRYQNWVGHFFGIGNDVDIDDYISFDRETFFFMALVESNLGLPPALQFFRYGMVLDINHSTMEFREYDGEIALPANPDGWRTALGYHLTVDTRDNPNWARHGMYLQWEHRFYTDALGDFSFTYQELDLRTYGETIWNTSMAVGLMWQRSDGDVPFEYMAGPDGIKRFRGVETKYFRDNQALMMQVELRKTLFWRLAGDIFFEGGKVGPYFSQLLRNEWHRSVGFGGKFALNKSERLYARAEFSWVDFKSLGMTFYFREAF